MLRNIFATFDCARINHLLAWLLDDIAQLQMLTFALVGKHFDGTHIVRLKDNWLLQRYAEQLNADHTESHVRILRIISIKM